MLMLPTSTSRKQAEEAILVIMAWIVGLVKLISCRSTGLSSSSNDYNCIMCRWWNVGEAFMLARLPEQSRERYELTLATLRRQHSTFDFDHALHLATLTHSIDSIQSRTMTHNGLCMRHQTRLTHFWPSAPVSRCPVALRKQFGHYLFQSLSVVARSQSNTNSSTIIPPCHLSSPASRARSYVPLTVATRP